MQVVRMSAGNNEQERFKWRKEWEGMAGKGMGTGATATMDVWKSYGNLQFDKLTKT